MATTGAENPNVVVQDGAGDSPAEGALQPGGSRVTESELTRAGGERVSRDLRSRDYIPEARVMELNAPVLRAVAQDRGYKLNRNGDESTREAFIAAQADDPRFKDVSAKDKREQARHRSPLGKVADAVKGAVGG